MDTAELLQSGFRYAMSLAHDRAAADDLLQEAWARVLSAGGPRHKGYLFATIRNVFYDRARRNKVVQFVPMDERPESSGCDVDLERVVARRQLLDRALGMLDAEEREVLFLSVVEGHTAREIGGMKDKPRNTVLSILHRARQRVKSAFEPGIAKEVLG